MTGNKKTYLLEVQIYDDEIEEFETVINKVIEQGDKRMRDEVRISNTLMTEFQIVGLKKEGD
jgi:hypothetical protein